MFLARRYVNFVGIGDRRLGRAMGHTTLIAFKVGATLMRFVSTTLIAFKGTTTLIET